MWINPEWLQGGVTSTSSAQEGQVEELSPPEPPQPQGMQFGELCSSLVIPPEQLWVPAASRDGHWGGQPDTGSVPAMAGVGGPSQPNHSRIP